MTIANIIADKGGRVATVKRTDSVFDIARTLRELRIGAVLVLDGSDLCGIVSERDIVRALAQDGAGILEDTAEHIMTAPVITCTPDDTVQSAMALMTSRRIRHLPVLDSAGALAGIVSIGDLVKRRIEDAEKEAAALKDYIVAT